MLTPRESWLYLSDEQPRATALFTLWDMQAFWAGYFLALLRFVRRAGNVLPPGDAPAQARLNLPLTEDYREYVESILGHLKNDSEKFALKKTLARLERLESKIALARTYGQLDADRSFADEIGVLLEAVEDDLKDRERMFLFIAPDKVEYYGSPQLFGAPVFEAFPSARDDVTDAGNCYATENFTACVFHCMRVAERGLRAVAKELKVTKIGPHKHPLEYAEWGAILGALNGKLKAAQQMQGRNTKKAALTKFYANAASNLDYLNEIWRKDVSHARYRYNDPEALNALRRTRDFMQGLAERLHE